MFSQCYTVLCRDPWRSSTSKDYDKYMQEATISQAQTLYRICHLLTNVMLQPIHIVRLDERTLNLFILAGQGETIEIEIQPDGSIEP
jgi:hypothetical protein